MRDSSEERDKKKKGKGKYQGYQVVVARKPDKERMVGSMHGGKHSNFSVLGCFGEELAEVEMLSRLFKCLSTTESISDFIKKRGKRK